MTTLTPAQLIDLETLLDSTSLQALLTALRDICDAKADHIQENWQDTGLANAWNKAAVQVGNCAGRTGVVSVS